MKYTAITIGPIYKTLQSVKSTKAIWAASYMFSYLMKEIIKKVGFDKNDVVLPFYEGNDLTDITGVGLFPDRLIVKNEIHNLQKNIDEVIEDFAKKVCSDIAPNKKKEEAFIEKDVIDYLKEYLRIYHLEIELDDKDNVILEVNKYLDTLELKQATLSKANIDYLDKFFEEKYYNFLVTSEFDISERRFPSTIEIANAELKDLNLRSYNSYVKTHIVNGKNKTKDDTDNQQAFIDAIKEEPIFKGSYRNYQKYISVVQADGDNIGAFIKQLYQERNPQEIIKRFSRNLLSFSKESVQLINDYQGTPIYAGGDDLLFIAPVAHTSNEDEKIRIQKSIFTLIDEIDKLFHKYFTGYNEDGFDFESIINNSVKKPSMSYGVSISYYKFPLNEALNEGVNQLFNIAKQTCKKDAVSYAVLKHSGHYFGTTFHKAQPSYKSFNTLLKQKVENGEYIKGLAYKLEPQQSVFYGIAKVEVDEVRNRMFDNFFKNNFNESIHTQKVNNDIVLIPFLENLKQLFKDVYTENKISSRVGEQEMEKTNLINLNKIYAALRFIGFLNNKEER